MPQAAASSPHIHSCLGTCLLYLAIAKRLSATVAGTSMDSLSWPGCSVWQQLSPGACRLAGVVLAQQNQQHHVYQYTQGRHNAAPDTGWNRSVPGAAIVGRTLSQGGRRMSTWPSSIPKLLRHQSMDSGLLSAYRSKAGEDGMKPVGSGPSGSKPRRASLPVTPKRRLSSLWTKDPPSPDAYAARRHR